MLANSTGNPSLPNSVAPAALIQNPLTCIMPIKSPQDYQALVKLLPSAHDQITAALDAIGTVHFARFIFLQNNTQLGIITDYDGDFAKYISDFATYIGPIFDAMFAHIADAPPLPVKKNTEAFIEYVRQHDLPSVRFYSAYPSLSVIEIRHLSTSA